MKSQIDFIIGKKFVFAGVESSDVDEIVDVFRNLENWAYHGHIVFLSKSYSKTIETIMAFRQVLDKNMMRVPKSYWKDCVIDEFAFFHKKELRTRNLYLKITPFEEYPGEIYLGKFDLFYFTVFWQLRMLKKNIIPYMIRSFMFVVRYIKIKYKEIYLKVKEKYTHVKGH
jgi:hypothetical protein